ncbi:MAG TPA: type III pantothenate kinase, partial [Chitinophagaceae bacterium]
MNSVTLCFDFGNTRLKAALFVNSALEQVVVMKDESSKTIASLLDQFHPQKTILSSVIDHDPKIEELLS